MTPRRRLAESEDSKPIPGFALDDCDRMHTTDAIVQWRKGQTDIGSLAGKPVRLRFELMYGAKLYAFRTLADSPEISSTDSRGKAQPD